MAPHGLLQHGDHDERVLVELSVAGQVSEQVARDVTPQATRLAPTGQLGQEWRVDAASAILDKRDGGVDVDRGGMLPYIKPETLVNNMLIC